MGRSSPVDTARDLWGRELTRAGAERVKSELESSRKLRLLRWMEQAWEEEERRELEERARQEEAASEPPPTPPTPTPSEPPERELPAEEA